MGAVCPVGVGDFRFTGLAELPADVWFIGAPAGASEYNADASISSDAGAFFFGAGTPDHRNDPVVLSVDRGRK